jgi:hypothetical protein
MKNFFKIQFDFLNLNHCQGLFVDFNLFRVTVWVDNFYWQGSLFSVYKSFKTDLMTLEFLYTGEIKI